MRYLRLKLVPEQPRPMTDAVQILRQALRESVSTALDCDDGSIVMRGDQRSVQKYLELLASEPSVELLLIQAGRCCCSGIHGRA